jgi:hypothetical protein
MMYDKRGQTVADESYAAILTQCNSLKEMLMLVSHMLEVY